MLALAILDHKASPSNYQQKTAHEIAHALKLAHLKVRIYNDFRAEERAFESLYFRIQKLFSNIGKWEHGKSEIMESEMPGKRRAFDISF